MISLEKPSRFSFHLTSSCYSFPWQFDGRFLRLQIGESIVEIWEEGDELLARVIGEKVEGEEIERALGLDLDLEKYYSLIRQDPLLSCLERDLDGLRPRKTLSYWISCLIAVCQQNAGFKQGWRMLGNLCLHLGDRIDLGGGRTFYSFPDPRRILERSEYLRICGVGYRASTIMNLAREFLENDLEDELASSETPDAIERLKSIKGIGDYSAKLALILSDGRYELFPVDRWFRRIIAAAYRGDFENPLGERECEKLALERWDGFAGVSAIMITVVLDAEPIGRALDRIRRGEIGPKLDADYPTPMTLWRTMRFEE